MIAFRKQFEQKISIQSQDLGRIYIHVKMAYSEIPVNLQILQ